MKTEEHSAVVLSAVLAGRVDLLREMQRVLTEEYFTEPVHAGLFRMMDYYYQTTDGVLTRAGLVSLMDRTRADEGRKALYEETFDALKSREVDDTDFLWALHEMQEDYAESNIKEVLTTSMEIVTRGTVDSRGEVLQGQEDARAFLTEKLSNLDQELNKDSSPHGDMRDEGDIILAEYRERREARAANRLAGIRFGVRALDEKVGGLQPGELILSAGYSSDGKTSLCVQLAWSAAVEQKKNVLFLTTETVNTVIRRKLIARHSRYHIFDSWGLPEGLNTRNLKEGSLSDQEYGFLEEVVRDFGSEDYGRLYIYQVPRLASMEVVEQIMRSVQRSSTSIW